jgi:putative ABC transport system substrate-binding protein
MGLWKGAEEHLETRRRLLLGTIAAAIAGPGAWAQGRPGGPLLGFLADAGMAQEILKPLAELGYVQGSNLRVEVLGAAAPKALPAAASRLLALRPDVLVADGPAVVVLAAFTREIPIVCGGVPDPVGSGLAQSLARPGGNVTGLSTGSPDTAGIVLGLLKQMRPRLRRIVVLHAEGVPVQVQMRTHAEAAKAAGLEWVPMQVASVDDVERLAPYAGEAAWLAPLGHPRLWKPVLEAAHKHRIATIGGYPGALMWYGRDFTDAPRRIAAIVDKILKGAKPADIPFELPDRQYFTLNRSTAQAIGIEIPADVLLRATEVVG